MTAAQLNSLVNLLAPLTLLEMMFAVGLGVSWSELVRVLADWKLVFKAVVASYVLVPAAAVGLLLLFQSHPTVAVGFLIIAVCPGAPYGPPLTKIAGGDPSSSVGLMAVLAGSSALVAPGLLQGLLSLVLPYLPASAESASIAAPPTGQLILTLLLTQFLPLSLGMAFKYGQPARADLVKVLADRVSLILNVTLLGLILAVQGEMLLQISFRGYLGMLALILAGVVAGALLRHGTDSRPTVMAASVRNVGVCLVIVTSSFPNPRTIGAVTAFAVFQTLVMLLVALAWGRLARSVTPGE